MSRVTTILRASREIVVPVGCVQSCRCQQEFRFAEPEFDGRVAVLSSEFDTVRGHLQIARWISAGEIPMHRFRSRLA